MDRETVMKELDRILDLNGVAENREAIKEGVYAVVSEAYSDGWSDGYDEVAEEQSIPYPED